MKFILPMRSIAARLSGVWLGIWSVAGDRTRYMRALAVSRVIAVSRPGTPVPPLFSWLERS